MNRIYFDHNACAPLKITAYEKMLEVLQKPGNASSIHSYGRYLLGIIEQARSILAQKFGSLPKNIVFHSCGTEANHFIIRGFEQQGYRILISATDHLSVLQAADSPLLIPVDENGLIKKEILENLLKESIPTLVSIGWANSETGVVQDINTLCSLTQSYGALFHTDAIQAAGRLPIDFSQMKFDALTVSSSKLGGPCGVAASFLKEGISLPALLRGGSQEKNRRAGTLNAPAIAGFGQAVKDFSPKDWQPIKKLRDFLEERLKSICPPLEIYGDQVERLPNTSFIRMPGVPNDLQLMTFDLAGCAVSAGSACSSGKINASHVLSEMGIEASHALEAIRVSLGLSSTASEVERFIALWTNLYDQHSSKIS